jgi:hypothetical protein
MLLSLADLTDGPVLVRLTQKPSFMLGDGGLTMTVNADLLDPHVPILETGLNERQFSTGSTLGQIDTLVAKQSREAKKRLPR